MTVFVFCRKTKKIHIIPKIEYSHPVYLRGKKIIYGHIRVTFIRKTIDFIFDGKRRRKK